MKLLIMHQRSLQLPVPVSGPGAGRVPAPVVPRQARVQLVPGPGAGRVRCNVGSDYVEGDDEGFVGVQVEEELAVVLRNK